MSQSPFHGYYIRRGADATEYELCSPYGETVGLLCNNALFAADIADAYNARAKFRVLQVKAEELAKAAMAVREVTNGNP